MAAVHFLLRPDSRLILRSAASVHFVAICLRPRRADQAEVQLGPCITCPRNTETWSERRFHRKIDHFQAPRRKSFDTYAAFVSEENKMACCARYNSYGVDVKNKFRFLTLFLDGFHGFFRKSGPSRGPLQVCQGASAYFEYFPYNYYFGAKTSSSLAGNELGRWFFRTSGRASTSHIAPLWLWLACLLALADASPA